MKNYRKKYKKMLAIIFFVGYKCFCSDGGVVQLVRIHACHAWGHGFEPRRSRHGTQKAIFR